LKAVSESAGVADSGGMWHGREGSVATKHGKESVIVPPVEARTGLRLDVAPGIDTDIFGTFDGRTPRTGTLREAALAKARYGAELARLSIGIASEGAYGPHPTLPFVGGGMEVLVLVDRTLDVTISEHVVVHHPVFVSGLVEGEAELETLLDRACFPSHALMVGFDLPEDRTEWTRTGVHDRDLLETEIARLRNAGHGEVRIASDMRADRNPTRMSTIADLADRFARRLATECSECGTGGFGWVAYLRGLPCESCGGPSTLVRGEVHGCARCPHTEERGRTDGRTVADVGDCPACHP